MRRKAQKSQRDADARAIVARRSTPKIIKDRSPTLYKYLRLEHARAMVERGVIKIGTLYEFRDQEGLGDAIGDSGEGTRTLAHDIGSGHWRDVHKSPIASRLISAPPDANITFKNVGLSLSENFPDAYVYCATSEPSARAMTAFGAEVCVKIEQPQSFFLAVTQELAKRQLHKGQWFLAPCVYTDRRMPYDRQVPAHPAQLKPPRYSYQKEVRAVWQPLVPPIHSEIIECPAATKYLSLFPL